MSKKVVFAGALCDVIATLGASPLVISILFGGSVTVTTRKRDLEGKNVGLLLLEDGEGEVDEVILLLTPLLELSDTRDT